MANLHINANLPLYIPLHHELVREFETADSNHLLVLQEVQNAIDDVSAQGKAYIDFVLSDDNRAPVQVNQDTLNTLLTALRQHIVSKYELECWKQSAHQARARIRNQQRNEPELTVETMDLYREYGEKRQFADEIIHDYQDDKELKQQERTMDQVVNTYDTYVQLRNLVYILQDPSNPLPTDADNEDDVAVAGGKISLRDPLSLDYYEEPVISRKCMHVFSRATIHQYLAGSSGRLGKNCPVDGCEATISFNDLKPDLIMALRMKVFRKRGREQRNIERI